MGLEGFKGNEFTWNATISGFVQSREMVEGVELFRDMLVEGFKPNPVTITVYSLHLDLLGMLTVGKKENHGLIYRTNMHNNVCVASALIDMYSKCGCVKHARNMYNTIPSKNIVSWKKLMSYHAVDTDHEDILEAEAELIATNSSEAFSKYILYPSLGLPFEVSPSFPHPIYMLFVVIWTKVVEVFPLLHKDGPLLAIASRRDTIYVSCSNKCLAPDHVFTTQMSETWIIPPLQDTGSS
ncbi:tetratricopeptide-like helical domain-containing protein [Artemisia annua]|uniref:Tetratricopeptide-like helical domain-containing protein n=1 Tax=Artemisia annua TaxID=35608 RepID=A0A2U1KTK5_ARTAN|nr:tetratricopeptide-like helical domain-containing protein [Artemisia annua]